MFDETKLAMTQTIEEFAESLLQDVVAEANIAEDGAMLPTAFTEFAIAAMTEAADWPEGTACYHRQRGAEVSAWGWDAATGTLNLAVTRFGGSGAVERLPKSEAEVSLRRLRKFLELAAGDLHQELEESSPAFDAAYRINRSLSSISRVRLYLLTDMITSLDGVEETAFDDIAVSQHVWDLERLHRLFSSGREREQIDVDLVELIGEGLPFLEAPSSDPNLQSYLLVIPGQALADLYSEYGPQLLELNVRSFLQARGKVNRGIRQTVIDQPERIFAYNNGISATASAIRVDQKPGELPRLIGLTDLQIVNGGQTTASIATVHSKDRISVGDVSVQAKLTVVPADKVSEIVPLISRYSNSQNKVSEADLTANHPYHVQIEKLSRSVWAPAPEGAGHRETRWFYERARGQYNDALSRERTPARKRDFRQVHPNAQKFTKTDIAKFENTWRMKPHLVGRGAQKNFVEFMLGFENQEVASPGIEHFQQLCAKAIMYRTAEKIVARQQFGGWRANIVTYTLSVINRRTKNQLDLLSIWRSQTVGPALAEAIESLSHQTHAFITNPPGGQNIGEFCKKEVCWKTFREMDHEIPSLRSELVSGNRPNVTTSSADVSIITQEQWTLTAEWIAAEQLLPSRLGSLARSLARTTWLKRDLSDAQVKAAADLITRAQEVGFTIGGHV